MNRSSPFDTHFRNAIPPAIVVVIFMWMFYWADYLFVYDFHQLGLEPRNQSGLIGIFFMPWIHAHDDVKHILNNTIPTFLLLTLLFYSYREIAWRIFLFSWLLTGLLLWMIAVDNGAHHIGMSGVIYSLAAFLFCSGLIRKYLPLQALSLFIVFLYGSMIWGVFPTRERVSWEGHLSGMLIGILLAFYYRKKGPQRPKYQYEIEKEQGIEPPDLEGMYLERLKELEEEKEIPDVQHPTVKIHYEYKSNEPDKNQSSS